MRTTNEVYDMCRYYVSDHVGIVPTDLIEKLTGYIRARRYDLLADANALFDPAKHGSTEFRFLRQVGAFFKKNDTFSEDERCRQAARLSFERGEKICRITNRRLDHYYLQRDRLDPDLQLYMDDMERYIQKVLGRFSEFRRELPYLIRVSSGATASTSRERSLPYLKVRKKIECTARARRYLSALSHTFGYGKVRTVTNDLNRVEVVPKNWKTYRTIACEPAGNMPLQLAFDRYVKGRLRKRGIDLSDQSKNQTLAKEASISGKYATVDLSMASDTLAFNLVAWLLPHDWFEYVSDIRSKGFRSPYGTGIYAKFSSMGNGTTFALETLVFAAACHAVGSKDFSVYGDDIIIETELYPELVRVMRFLGFVVNQEKSFSTGPFRESCGKDWFNGKDVTPVYVRATPKGKSQWCHLINTLASVSIPEGRLWEYLRAKVHKLNLKYVPYNYDTASGIHLDASTSYAEGLIRSKYYRDGKTKRNSWIQMFKCYMPKQHVHRTSDIRALFLWYLRATQAPRSTEARISSWVSNTSHKYVTRWTCWFPPAGVTPDHLYWWSDYVNSPR